MRLALVFMALALLAGCGGTTVQRGKLHGTVKYNGKVVTSGTLIFMGSDNQSYVADLDKEGNYSVDRIPYGPVKVALQQSPIRPTPKADPNIAVAKGLESKDSARPAPATEAPKYAGLVVPPKYNQLETSELSFEMKSSDQEWSVDLK